jgi:DNA-binding HxlR family transcriptional regulator
MDHRLSELSQAGLVTRIDDLRYDLTDTGRALRRTLEALDEWARHWVEADQQPSVSPS